MFIAGINFALHFTAWGRRSVRHYAADPEFRFYVFILAVVAVLTIIILAYSGTYGFSESIVKGLFQVVSIATTTGFTSADFNSWPRFLP